jgi:hypothetical protein
MLNCRPVAYVIPVAEQDFASLTPVVQIVNAGTVPCLITGHVHIYRESTGLKLYTSELSIRTLIVGAVADVPALTPWSPPAPADDDYFIMCDVTATATLPHEPPGAIFMLGPYTFDIKPVGMGPAPAAHAVTHEDGGSDELDVTDLLGVLADPQVPAAHDYTHSFGGSDTIDVEDLGTAENFTYFRLSPAGGGRVKWNSDTEVHHPNHEDGGSDELEIETLPTAELDDNRVLAPDGAGGVEFRAESGGGGGPTPTGTGFRHVAAGVEDAAAKLVENVDVHATAAIAESKLNLNYATHARQHAITTTADHTSGATSGKLLKADANGLPIDASNTDTQLANTIRQFTPQTLTDQAAIDWDLAAGGAAKVTLAGNRSMNAPTNMVEGAWYRLRFIQDATGTRLITWNAVFKWPGAVAPCLSAAPNNIDIIYWTTDGTSMYCIGMTNALA